MSKTSFSEAQLISMLARAEAEVERLKTLLAYFGSDTRPQLCRQRLKDEGQAYPKSGCLVCRTGGLFGCPFENRAC